MTELLADAEINSILIPDIIESRMYKKAMTVNLHIMQEVFERTRINCLGLEMGAVPSRYLKDSDQSLLAAVPDRSLHLRTLNSDQLREHLTKLSAERQILVDLLRSNAPEAAAETMEGSALDEQVTRNFEKICAKEPLARTLNRVKVVDVPIHLPYKLASDIVGYPNWMPWCTAGEEFKDSADQREYEATVGFGIVCPPFGTLQVFREVFCICFQLFHYN